MSDYCCFFVDKEDHVRDIRPHVKCADDAEALRIAEKLLAEKLRMERWRFEAVEIWDHIRKVGRRTRLYQSGGEDFAESELASGEKVRAVTGRVAAGSGRGGLPEVPTNDFVEGLCREHRNIESLLHVLERELAVFDRGDRPDYEVVRAVIDYFKDYPDLCHHPREEMIFEKLKIRDPTVVGKIGDLEVAHREGARRLRRVAEAVDAVLQDQEILRQTVDDLIRGFIDHQREHIAMEESLFFPVALKVLRPADWADLALQLGDRPDPFGQLDFEQKFNMLRRDILEMENEADAARSDRQR